MRRNKNKNREDAKSDKQFQTRILRLEVLVFVIISYLVFMSIALYLLDKRLPEKETTLKSTAVDNHTPSKQPPAQPPREDVTDSSNEIMDTMMTMIESTATEAFDKENKEKGKAS